jgi:hypothetical protein
MSIKMFSEDHINPKRILERKYLVSSWRPNSKFALESPGRRPYDLAVEQPAADMDKIKNVFRPNTKIYYIRQQFQAFQRVDERLLIAASTIKRAINLSTSRDTYKPILLDEQEKTCTDIEEFQVDSKRALSPFL